MSKIELEYPFSKDWCKGYLIFNSKEERYIVILYNTSKDRSGVSYARYLMSVYLGRYLKESEHVDHINEDKKDDRLENLQILTQNENNLKHKKAKNKIGRTMRKLVCSYCGKEFEREVRQLYKNQKSFYCSISCKNKGAKYYNNRTINPQTREEIKRLKREEGLSCYKIAELLNVSRNTVMKYW